MAEKFWVPDGTNGTGNTSVVTHWDDASGGAGGDAVPGSGDDMNFDALSFLATLQTVTVDANASFNDMDWTGVTNSPVLATGTKELQAKGDITFVGMSITGTGEIFFTDTSGNQTLTTNGITLPKIQVYNSGASTRIFILGDNLTCTLFRHSGGVSNLNGKTISCTEFSDAGSTLTRTLTMGSAIINCTSVSFAGANLTLTANTAVINDSGAFAGGYTNWNIVNLTGATSTITGNNSFKEIGLMRSGVQTITGTGTTQTVQNMRRDAGIAVKTLVNGTYVNKGGRIIVLPYMSISGATFTPASAWYFPNSTDGGGNTGGIFNKYPPNSGGWFILHG